MKYALRYLWRNKIATAINVSGLAVALSAAFLMLQYLDFELSHDTWLPGHENVYRIATEQKDNGIVNKKTAATYYGTEGWLLQNFPEVTAATHINRWPANTGFTLEVDGKLFNEKNYLIADKGLFKVFPSWLISGNAETCLDGTNLVLLSDRLALKIFGTTDVLGKTITNPNWKGHVFEVKGVFRSAPTNVHLDADIIHAEEWIPDAGDEWRTTRWTYVRIKEGTDVKKLQDKINASVSSMLPDKNLTASLTLQPLSSIHLTSNLEDEIAAPGNMINIYIVLAALIIIMLMAWINYVNLETARFIKRLKDVGIRRIIGSSKSDLLKRFLVEFALIATISIMLSVVLTSTVFPYFGYITGLPLTTPAFNVPYLWICAIAIFMITALVAGTYPFISLFRINPVASLKGKITENFQGVFVRRSLLTFQLAASLTMMALVVMASLQLDFMRDAKMNFNTNSIVTIYNSANYTYMEDSLRKEKNDVFRNKLAQIPSIVNLSTSSAIPGEPIGFTYTDLAKRSLSDPDRQVHYKVMYIDYDFIPLFGLEMLAGRNYSREYSDTNCLVITESTARELGFKSADEALNQKIYFQEEEWEQWTVIGIVKDYRHESIKTPANPGIFRLHRNKGQMVYYSIKLSEGANTGEVIPAIEQLWKETWPGKPFDYFFLDQHYDQQYKSEMHFSRVFSTFSGIAVFIACLGIMGMTLFEANARIKEIGIRKVLGAAISDLVMLLTKGSLKTLVISLVIAVPLIYPLSKEWLSGYPEHIDLSIWIVALPFLLMTILVFFTSLSQILKNTRKNPVDSLKHE